MAEYRTGRTLVRTIYRGDDLIGIMDTPELGAMVVDALNRASADGPLLERLQDAEGELRERLRKAEAQFRQQLGAAGEGWEIARGEATLERERRARVEAELSRLGVAREKLRQELADAKRELAEAPQPRVLWQGRTGSLPGVPENEDVSLVTFNAPPGTRVRVIEDTETPEVEGA